MELGRLFEVEEVGGRDVEEVGRLLEEGGRLDDEGRDDALEEVAVVALSGRRKRHTRGGMHFSRLMNRSKTKDAQR